MYLILLSMLSVGGVFAQSYGKYDYFGGPPTSGTIGQNTSIKFFYVMTPDSYTAKCSFSNDSYCDVTFYKDGIQIDLDNTGKYDASMSFEKTSCTLTSETNSTITDIQLYAKNKGFNPIEPAQECIVITLKINDLEASDFNINYSSHFLWSQTCCSQDPLAIATGVVLYNKDNEEIDTINPSMFYYYATDSYVSTSMSNYYYHGVLYHCGFYGTTVESIRWFIRPRGGESFGDIENGDYYGSFDKYNKTYADGNIVETFLLITGKAAASSLYEIYCTDTKSTTNSTSDVFKLRGVSPNFHLDSELGFLFWLIAMWCFIPLMAIIVSIFGIFACIRARMCSCCGCFRSCLAKAQPV